MRNNILNMALASDSYKLSHANQYPPNTTEMFSYFESRGGAYHYDRLVFFGLQYYLKKYLTTPVAMEDVEEAKQFAEAHGCPFNYEGWKHIANLGYLPVKIRAVPEGSVIPLHNIIMSVESTDPKVFWLVNWLETMLVRVWYPTTVATQSFEIKNMIYKHLTNTAENPDDLINFKLHDFGYRGASSEESALIGGMAHLVNFMGSDTIAGILGARKYYNEEMAAFSIPATEHSTITSWGKDREEDAYRNIIELYGNGPSPLYACVSDSYDIFNAAKNIWGGTLKQEVLNAKNTLVIRPDSGQPDQVILQLCEILGEQFGFEKNSLGYKVLHPKVRIIQGDGVNRDSIEDVLDVLKAHGWSGENIGFGMGGALLQDLNRDTLKFAFKCSSVTTDGKEVEVYKTPIGDTSKNSKRGKLDLVNMKDNEVVTVFRNDGYDAPSIMLDVFENGKILHESTFAEIRERTKTPYTQYKGWLDRRP